MKKHNFFWMVAMAIVVLIISACDSMPTTEACLVSGDPECDNLPGSTGGSGNSNCSNDPNIGQTCDLPDGSNGTWVCTPNGLRCADGNGGTGGDGGASGTGNTGGTGSYNCHDDPNNGTECVTPQGKPGEWGCNANGTGLYCYPNGGGGTGGDGGGDQGGNGGYNCHEDPGLYSPCTTSNGHIGVQVCNANGTGLVCQCTDTNCGNGGTGGNSGGGQGGDGGSGGVYNCITDPQLGASCSMGTGVCSRNGQKICNQAGDGLMCSAVAGGPNPSGEICSNGLDDNCNGAVDDLPCTNGGGSGGSGGTGGSGGSGGGATCTPVTSANIMVTGSSSLTTLLKGEASINSSNPLSLGTFTNLQLLSIAAGNGLSITTSTVGAQMNVWTPYTGGGGDPMPLIDSLFCRQLGINPPNPASCNAGVIGDRKSAAYLSALRIDWECWRKGSAFCPSTINSYVPGDLFALVKIVANGDGDSESFSGSKWRILEMPPKCP